MHFDVHAFISYSHLDNEELVEGHKGWVANLHWALERRIAMFLGKKPHIWRDPKLQGNEVFAETLSERLKSAAVLVAVVSPPYVNSEWTRRELLEFCRAAEQQGGIRVRQKARIFKVVKSPVPILSHPPELQPLLGYEFFKIDPDTGRIRELNELFGEPAHREFWMKLDDLAQEMCTLLKEMEAPPGGDEGHVAPRETIFLAETTSDLREQRETLKRDLQQHGYLVLPAEPLPDVAADLEERIRADLSKCRLSIHLFGRNYGLVPEGGTASQLEIQNELAIERAGSQELCRLLWIRPGLEVTDERQRKVLEQLRNDPRLEAGADLLETFLEDFRTLIHARLDALRRPAPVLPAVRPPVAPAGGSTGIRSVYLINDERDASVASRWSDVLFAEQFEVIHSSSEGDEAEIRSYHEENLRTCDGVIIFYGAGNEMWVRRKLRELQKIAGYGRTKPAPVTAICVIPPNKAEKDRFRTHEAIVIRPGDDVSPEPLAPFISSLRGEGRQD